MSEGTAESDRLAGLVDEALGRSRDVRARLRDSVVPALPPLRRGAAEHLIRAIDRGRLFEATTLHELDALIAQVEREAEAGTHRGWEADAHHVRGGWPTIVREPEARGLAAGAAALRRLHDAIATVRDAVEAERITNRLLAED